MDAAADSANIYYPLTPRSDAIGHNHLRCVSCTCSRTSSFADDRLLPLFHLVQRRTMQCKSVPWRRIPPPPAPSNPNSSENPDPRGASISPAAALFHTSVRQRMEASEMARRSAKSLWFKKKPYRPRARLIGRGEPKFVRLSRRDVLSRHS